MLNHKLDTHEQQSAAIESLQDTRTTSKLVWWILGLFSTLVLTLVIGWGSSINSTQMNHEHRIGTLESESAVQQSQYQESKEWRQKVDDKLDLIIQRGQKGR